MRTGERNSLARKLALVLRHAPEKFDLEMDINGWIDVKDIIRQFKKGGKRFHWLRPHHFTAIAETDPCLLYTSPSPRDGLLSRMPSSA